MSTFTVSKNLEQVARGGDLGTWDTPENSNWAIVDAALGQSVTIGLNNSNVVLSSPQYQVSEIIFNSTLTGSVNITFPSTFFGPYIIQNLCTGTSAFTITLTTTVAGGQVIACPPGDSFNAINDGTNLKFHNLDRVGSYWDYAGSSVPAWISGCTVPPYLNCNGTTFSSATYPALTTILGSTTLPDSRGRVRAALNAGTGRVTNITDTVGSAGGDQLLQAHTHANVLTDLGHTHNYSAQNGTTFNYSAGGFQGSTPANFTTGSNNSTPMSLTNASAGGGAGQNVQPTYMGGLTLIRAA